VSEAKTRLVRDSLLVYGGAHALAAYDADLTALAEARAFVQWCQAFAENTREAGSLRAKLRDLSPSLTRQGTK
jgi:hypothetical protein